MCSRYIPNRRDAKILLREKVLLHGAWPYDEVRPTDFGPLILPGADDFFFAEMRWGWRVSFSSNVLFNAKSETLTTLKTFAPHLDNRCLIVAESFFEKGVEFTRPEKAIFLMAGLWREEADGRKFTMLTTAPNDSVSPYHQRMPFILANDMAAGWLGADWKAVLTNPDKSPLEKNQKQGELF